MKFFNIFMLVVLALALVSVGAAPEPKWKVFKKVEKAVRRVRDETVKAGPAVAVVASAASIGK